MVAVWEREFVKSPRERRLQFVYLANHIMQESRKKGPEFVSQFQVRAANRVIPRTFHVGC